MKEEKLKLSIKPNCENATRSADYSIKLNGWELGRGVTKIDLSMPAGKKPKLTIECYLDEVDIVDVLVDKSILPLDYLVNNQAEDCATS